ncbi:hypothetical protein TNCV_3722031 [Trichonephila clavipes]|nr:hypothetical protein TNCV_3722031 [Trichonephila clavipes]
MTTVGRRGSAVEACVGHLLAGKTRREKKKGEREKKKRRREREEPGIGWRKGKSSALDGEDMRGEPWLERTGREHERKALSPRLEWKDDERRWR